ncbi:MAG TPA: hypothetical protein PLG43_11780 [Spirochaetia bacterium]|jgi:ankyrin repeat protein|nr:hypothetical protein [Spirochaetia bacterium]
MLSRHLDICATLIELAQDRHIPHEAFGEMLLSIAAYGDNPEILKMLLEAGADIEYRNADWGQTPLFISTVNGAQCR